MNLLEMMTPEEQELLRKRARNRVRRSAGFDAKITPEIYMLAEFGYYYGWRAVEAARNNEISFEEMFALNEAARKVWYQKLVENSRAQMVATASAMAKPSDAKRSFENGMKPFMNKTKLEE